MKLIHEGTMKDLRDLSVYEKVKFSTEELLKLIAVIPEIVNYSVESSTDTELNLVNNNEIIRITKIRNFSHELYIIAQHKTINNTRKYEIFIHIEED